MKCSTELEEDVLFATDLSESYQLVVWNDDINTFNWVIKALMDICHMAAQQAEQCSLLIHHKGKCGVKEGDYDELKTLRDAIADRSINATVEVRVG
jgi:ATP-dependent Clp protease adaptor protein ClpS